MQEKKIFALFVGARPNLPKLWTLTRGLNYLTDEISYLTIHTGQQSHPALTSDLISELGILIDINLDVEWSEQDSQRVSNLTGTIGNILRKTSPEFVVVVGDVNTSAVAAFVASRMGISVIHLEAGLRSRVNTSEEINRKVITACSQFHLATTALARENLLREGLDEQNIFLVGNPMAETFLSFDGARNNSTILSRLGLTSKNYVLFAVHKRMNVTNVEWLTDLLILLGRETRVVFPIHPHIDSIIAPYRGTFDSHKDIRLTGPLGYADFGALLDNAFCVVTDSAGAQEESTVAGVRCVTVGHETARPETIFQGTNKMIGFDVRACLQTIRSNEPVGENKIEYWDQSVSSRIRGAIISIINR
ncbi:MAG: UDP-N-acetyl glucosamine 2-epimerase [Pyrinomonadaceae bacterium]